MIGRNRQIDGAIPHEPPVSGKLLGEIACGLNEFNHDTAAAAAQELLWLRQLVNTELPHLRAEQQQVLKDVRTLCYVHLREPENFDLPLVLISAATPFYAMTHVTDEMYAEAWVRLRQSAFHAYPVDAHRS